MDALCTQPLWVQWRTQSWMKHRLLGGRGISVGSWRMNRNKIDLFLHSAGIYWATNCTRVEALCHRVEGRQPSQRTCKGGGVAWNMSWRQGYWYIELHGRTGKFGPWGRVTCLLLTGLFTIEYPVKEEAEISRAKVKSSPYLERSIKPISYPGEAVLLRSQSARPESSTGESLKEEHGSASISPTRRKSIRIQAKAVVTPRWAWASISSSLPVSGMVMGSSLTMGNKRDEAPFSGSWHVRGRRR